MLKLASALPAALARSSHLSQRGGTPVTTARALGSRHAAVHAADTNSKRTHHRRAVCDESSIGLQRKHTSRLRLCPARIPARRAQGSVRDASWLARSLVLRQSALPARKCISVHMRPLLSTGRIAQHCELTSSHRRAAPASFCTATPSL